MQGRDTVQDLKKLLIRENVKAKTIDRILTFYINAVKDENFQKQYAKVSEENYDAYIQQIIDMFRKEEYNDEMAMSYIKFVFEKITRSYLK